jgi:hypothetical protein
MKSQNAMALSRFLTEWHSVCIPAVVNRSYLVPDDEIDSSPCSASRSVRRRIALDDFVTR